ncbi:Ribosomal protein S18 acetylase RimI [Paenibacillus sp. ov031]|uniref:GNAT family N-acetyltransferase n=1 Tax=Paenibacillus sp. ov031 TaxID=1761879 RepID=UPI000914C326|nr:GNAT family N-acetyltransferase [Paenibacillus sp. ov031]SHN78002.1 Ribosomal protein S18 acetylase RimI [Paenibacillus sp. ov031]
MSDKTSYSLVAANQTSYAKYFATYRKNIWFRPSWASLQEMMLDASDCYWIYQNNQRVGGISLTSNELGSFFMIPPSTLTVDMVHFLKDYAIQNSGGQSKVDAYNVLAEHIDVLKSAGFEVLNTRKCMIRPTEKIENDLHTDCICIKPQLEHLPSIVQVMNESYRGGMDEGNLDTYRDDVSYYFEHNRQDELLNASSVLVDKKTNEVVGFCLISMWENMPLVYDIAVKPGYSNQGLGRYMLYKAISHLEGFSPTIRLFVTIGNKADYLYTKLGFLSGEEASHLVYRDRAEKR